MLTGATHGAAAFASPTLHIFLMLSPAFRRRARSRRGKSVAGDDGPDCLRNRTTAGAVKLTFIPIVNRVHAACQSESAAPAFLQGRPHGQALCKACACY